MVQTKGSTSIVLYQLKAWRSNKNGQPGIPDEIWASVFTLSEEMNASALRKLLGLNTKQYKKKWQQLRGDATSPAAAQADTVASGSGNTKSSPALAFCEVKPPTAPEEKPPIKPLAFTPPPHTYLAEFCRSDGCVMKIHATQQNIGELIVSFFNGVPNVTSNRKA